MLLNQRTFMVIKTPENNQEIDIENTKPLYSSRQVSTGLLDLLSKLSKLSDDNLDSHLGEIYKNGLLIPIEDALEIAPFFVLYRNILNNQGNIVNVEILTVKYSVPTIYGNGFVISERELTISDLSVSSSIRPKRIVPTKSLFSVEHVFEFDSTLSVQENAINNIIKRLKQIVRNTTIENFDVTNNISDSVLTLVPEKNSNNRLESKVLGIGFLVNVTGCEVELENDYTLYGKYEWQKLTEIKTESVVDKMFNDEYKNLFAMFKYDPWSHKILNNVF